MPELDAPPGAPQVCGALGHFDRERVLRMAAAFPAELRPAHEDGASILMLDRPPLRWSGRNERGLGWIEGALWQSGAPVADWRQAARSGACGLVVDGRRHFLHSAVNGLAALYWFDAGGATYFSSRIDPLVQAHPGRLSIDWDAWVSTIVLRFPIGQRTPFAEIRRLPQFSALRRRLGCSWLDSPSWPWREIEPHLSLSEAADAIVEGLDEAFAPLDRDAICPLSGGRDSRIVTCALAARRRASLALTVSDDEGDNYEEGLAAPVAARLGVPHEVIVADPDGYAADWAERAARVEHQFVDHAWLVPLARHIDGAGLVVGDGFAIDTLFERGSLFYTSGTLVGDPQAASLAMFDSMRQFGAAERALAEPLRAPLVDRARELFLAAAAPFEGHPSQATLSFYSTRTMRGVSRYPSGLLGQHAKVLTPGADEAVAGPALSVRLEEKVGDRLYPAVFDRLSRDVGRLPSTKDTPRHAPRLQRRWRSPSALRHHRELLADGPLSSHVSVELAAWLDAPDGVELSGDLRLGMEAVSLLHSWWNRYRDRLRDPNPTDLLA
jgi:asparagine synthetase B (glutamine-hydrolysing)